MNAEVPVSSIVFIPSYDDRDTLVTDTVRMTAHEYYAEKTGALQGDWDEVNKAERLN
jgi:hypothetical protein